MTPNVGTVDRAARAVLGVALVLLAFVGDVALLASPAMKWGAAVVGVVFVLTAGFRFCPLYRLLGVRTCRIR